MQSPAWIPICCIPAEFFYLCRWSFVLKRIWHNCAPCPGRMNFLENCAPNLVGPPLYWSKKDSKMTPSRNVDERQKMPLKLTITMVTSSKIFIYMLSTPQALNSRENCFVQAREMLKIRKISSSKFQKIFASVSVSLKNLWIFFQFLGKNVDNLVASTEPIHCITAILCFFLMPFSKIKKFGPGIFSLAFFHSRLWRDQKYKSIMNFYVCASLKWNSGDGSVTSLGSLGISLQINHRST